MEPGQLKAFPAISQNFLSSNFMKSLIQERNEGDLDIFTLFLRSPLRCNRPIYHRDGADATDFVKVFGKRET